MGTLTGKQLDDRIRDALLDAAAMEFAEVLADATPVQTSPDHWREMARMLQDPNGWARRQETRRRPLWKRAARTAAMVLLVCALAGASLLAVSPTLRAAVSRVLTEWYESHVVYRYDGPEIHDPAAAGWGLYEITDLPEGYALAGEPVEMPDVLIVTYEHNTKERIVLSVRKIQDGDMSVNVFGEERTIEAEVWGEPAQMYISDDPTKNSGIVWHNNSVTQGFYINAPASEQELLHMAESVSLVEMTK